MDKPGRRTTVDLTQYGIQSGVMDLP